jgi:hypothetical protein
MSVSKPTKTAAKPVLLTDLQERRMAPYMPPGRDNFRDLTARQKRGVIQRYLMDKGGAQVLDSLISKAQEGDLTAIKMWLEYAVGKPTKGPVADEDRPSGAVTESEQEDMRERAKRILERLEADDND